MAEYEFKVGDAVLLDTSRYGIMSYAKRVVSKVSPSGQVTVGKRRFKRGRLIGGDKWYAPHIFPWNEAKHPELVMLSNLVSMRRSLHAMTWATVSDAVVRTVFTLVKSYCETTQGENGNVE